jgi:hypothetical protein
VTITITASKHHDAIPAVTTPPTSPAHSAFDETGTGTKTLDPGEAGTKNIAMVCPTGGCPS